MKVGLFVLEHHHEGYCDELVHLPICDGCGKPITDFETANVIDDIGPIGGDFPDLGDVVAHIDGTPVREHPCEIKVFHWACDNTQDRFTGWTRVSSVFATDQRKIKSVAS